MLHNGKLVIFSIEILNIWAENDSRKKWRWFFKTIQSLSLPGYKSIKKCIKSISKVTQTWHLAVPYNCVHISFDTDRLIVTIADSFHQFPLADKQGEMIHYSAVNYLLCMKTE